jgi:hypothetical protein
VVFQISILLKAFSRYGQAATHPYIENILTGMTNKLIVRVLILLLLIIGIIFNGLHLMEVEDRYGDLQYLYWRSKDGNIIFNKVNSQVGIAELNKSRIYIKEGNQLLDLEEWLDPNDNRKFEAAIYRLKNSTDRQRKVTEVDLNSECKLITEVDVQY